MTNNKKIAQPLSIKKKSAARLAAVKAIYAAHQNKEDAKPLQLALDMMEYYQNRPKEIIPDKKFLLFLIEGTVNNDKMLENSIKDNLNAEWKIERIALITKCILQVAIFEILDNNHKLPYKALINEYLNIAHGFLSEKEVSFVNAILDKIAINSKTAKE